MKHLAGGYRARIPSVSLFITVIQDPRKRKWWRFARPVRFLRNMVHIRKLLPPRHLPIDSEKLKRSWPESVRTIKRTVHGMVRPVSKAPLFPVGSKRGSSCSRVGKIAVVM